MNDRSRLMTFLVLVLFLCSVFMAVLSARTLLTVKAEQENLLKPADQFAQVRANLIRAADVYKKTAEDYRLSAAAKETAGSQNTAQTQTTVQASAQTQAAAQTQTAVQSAAQTLAEAQAAMQPQTSGNVSYTELAGISSENASAGAPAGEGAVSPPDDTAVISSSGDGSSVFSGPSLNGHVVCLDPGHQSFDVDMSATEPNGPGSSTMKVLCTTGTAGDYTGTAEYELNLQIALLLKDILEQRGYQVVLTRTNNQTAISNMQRAQMAAAEGAEIFVRIHANSSGDHSASGALTLSPSQESPYVSHLFPESQRLSRCVLDGYCAATGFADLGILYDDTMTGINWSQVPVTIIEMGFMSNEHDDTMMNDPAFRKTMAAGIADGIDLYFSGAANGTSAAN